jgi:phosphatidylinositol alpha-1,6-mannosyltransferase
MKILFVTRKYPPSVGGMENVARDLYGALQPLANVRLVAYGGKNKYLPVAYPWLLLRALVFAWRQHPNVVYVQDGVMAPLGLVLRWVLRRPVVITIHGKEVTCSNPLYRRTVLPALRRLDRAVVISPHTQTITNTVAPRLPTTQIAWGVDDNFYMSVSRRELRSKLAVRLGISAERLHDDPPILLLAGRLVERKGTEWFIDKVVPMLVQRLPNLLCVITGKGPRAMQVAASVQRQKLERNIFLLGYVADKDRNMLYNAADLFVMPNIVIPSDTEGFGIVALEAASCGTPVIAANLEGLTAAVVPGKTGYLLPSGDADAFAERIVAELQSPTLARQKVRGHTLAHYTWERTAEEYIKVFEQTITQARMPK